MERVTKVSDVSGKDCANPIVVSIEREGWVMKIGNTDHVHRAVFDADVSELSDLVKSIQFVTLEESGIATALPGLPVAGQVHRAAPIHMTSFRPVSRRVATSQDIVSVPLDSPDFTSE